MHGRSALRKRSAVLKLLKPDKNSDDGSPWPGIDSVQRPLWGSKSKLDTRLESQHANRPLTQAERELAAWLLERGTSEAADYIRQLDLAEVTPERCACGCNGAASHVERALRRSRRRSRPARQSRHALRRLCSASGHRCAASRIRPAAGTAASGPLDARETQFHSRDRDASSEVGLTLQVQTTHSEISDDDDLWRSRAHSGRTCPCSGSAGYRSTRGPCPAPGHGSQPARRHQA